MSDKNKKICKFLGIFIVVAIIVAAIESAMGVHGGTRKQDTDAPIIAEDQTDTSDYEDGSLTNSGNSQGNNQDDTQAGNDVQGETDSDGNLVNVPINNDKPKYTPMQAIASLYKLPDNGFSVLVKTFIGGSEASIISEADRLALSYDYDTAIDMLKSVPSYSTNEIVQTKVKEYETTKSTLVRQDIYSITHIFFHSLIVDPSLAFDGDDTETGYQQFMTTIYEFNKIIEEMYRRGYVLVRLHDMYKEVTDANGNVTYQEGDIYLPPGKKAFVLSEDDVSFYPYMNGDGFARKMVIDENGDIKCEYENPDGSISIGDYDMAPLIETFVKEHPDFSYKGAKGCLVFTGYEGVLGYRTDPYEYGDSPELESEIEKAKVVAQALKDKGWELGSHSWGHVHMGASSYDTIVTDTEKWLNSVAPVIGGSDILIFPHGQDINDWTSYTSANDKFTYLKSKGFNIFCNVDASVTSWVQLGTNYLRQGRRNLDGYRMYYDMIDDSVDYLSDLFDVNEVFDPARPTPVPAL